MDEMVLKGILSKLVLGEGYIKNGRKVIRISEIVEIRYVKGTGFTNGYVVFCTGDGIGESVDTMVEAPANENAITFWYTQNNVLDDIVQEIKKYSNGNVIINNCKYSSMPKVKTKVEKLEEKKMKEELELAKVQRKQAKKTAKCPKCGSPSLSANAKGYGVVKGGLGALAGGALTGGVGVVIGLGAGNIGRKKVWVTCLNCGKKFKM